MLSFTFKLATNTPYAVMVLHDENENYQMDFNRLGLPKEDAANRVNEINMDRQNLT